MPNTEELLYQTKNKQPPKVFYKNVVLKNFAMFTGTPILKNIAYGCSGIDFSKGLFGTLFLGHI